MDEYVLRCRIEVEGGGVQVCRFVSPVKAHRRSNDSRKTLFNLTDEQKVKVSQYVSREVLTKQRADKNGFIWMQSDEELHKFLRKANVIDTNGLRVTLNFNVLR